MKLCAVSSALRQFSLVEAAKISRELGISALEISTGAWSKAPHCELPDLLANAVSRREFLGAVEGEGLQLAALNCNGNQLHPTDGDRQSKVVYDTVRLAALLGIDTIVMMSGLPAGGPQDQRPNWVTCAWPLENGEILDWQWNDVALPYWEKFSLFAAEHGVKKICVEMHGHQLVHNVPTLFRLREAIGPIVGANLDPSHLFWMGADPLAAVTALGNAIHHVHAKDTILTDNVRLRGRIETADHKSIGERAWNYITLGYGHDEQWWREFCYRLGQVGYDGWLSVEHEDPVLSPVEGLRKSVDLLENTMLHERAA